MNRKLLRGILSLIAVLMLSHAAFAQSDEYTLRANGTISVTNNGISIIPSFNLGDPAGELTLSIGRRFRFEPELRFALEGKPWSFLFPFKYDLYQDDLFYLRVGVQPAVSFKEVPAATINGQTRSVMEARRFLAGELTGIYTLNSRVSTGFYYLLSHGFDVTVPDYTNFLSWNTTFSNIPIGEALSFRVTSQIYFLDIDENNGFYVSTRSNLNFVNSPFSISSVYNKILETDIPGSEDNLWNVSLNYSFDF